MKNTFGNALGLTIFGESHGAAVGAVLDGLAAGLPVDEAYIAERMDRRRARGDGLSTARTEPDVVEFLSGVVNGHTTGTPITMMIRNTNTRSGDYDGLSVVPRPGHADYTAGVKYGGHADFAGGGAFSGRLTAPLCIAGGICLQLLKKQGIEVISRIASIGSVEDVTPLTVSTADKPWARPCGRRSPPPRRRMTPLAALWNVLCWVCPWDWADRCLTAWRAVFPPSSSVSPP